MEKNAPNIESTVSVDDGEVMIGESTIEETTIFEKEPESV
jgi:hypothetical protein